MKIKELTDKYIIPTYARYPVSITHGVGSWMWDEEGKKYLDLGSGIAVNTLGHSNRKVAKVLAKQSRRLVHCSNLYNIKEQAELAEFLVEKVVKEKGKCFFCNSGTEANEALLKLSRKFGELKKEKAVEVLTLKKSFHGRTFAGISLTGQEKVKTGFRPLLEEFKFIDFNNVEDLKSTVSSKTAAVLIEVVQGEGGINVASAEFLNEVSSVCKANNVLLFIDEVQAGLGRTGDFCSWKSILGKDTDFVPDAVSWAKGLGAGVPIGAIWVRDREIENSESKLCDLLSAGTHGSTFGGNPLVTSVAKSVLEEIKNKKLDKRAKKLGKFFVKEIEKLNSDNINSVKGIGFMLGIEIDEDKVSKMDGCSDYPTASSFVVAKLMQEGVVTIPAGTNVIRVLPPLNIKKKDLEFGINAIAKVLV